MKNHFDYEARENCFQKCEHVATRLILGDPARIPEPWLTVLVPTYRRTELLKEALESILIRQQHVDFFWDVVVIDNEPDDGKPNETEKLIQELDHPRILYYRNSEHIRPGDNFNRGILLARGKWVTMLHDDDLLMPHALSCLGKLIRAYDEEKHPLGAIAASYSQIEYDPIRNELKADIAASNQYFMSLPMSYDIYRITHNNVKILAHIGGTAPTCGCTFLRQAVLEAGGFNEDFGISGDLILFYNIERSYLVIAPLSPLGYYRWGDNGMVKSESTYRVIQDNYDFREYIYQKHPVIGRLFRNCHYKKFTTDAVEEHNKVSGERLYLADYDEIYSGRPNLLWYLFYKCVISRIYICHKKMQGISYGKKAARKMEREE